MPKKKAEVTTEIESIGVVHSALKGLDSTAQLRVLRYVAQMLDLQFGTSQPAHRQFTEQNASHAEESASNSLGTDFQATEDSEGINTVALRWMKRADLNAKGLQSLFSLGIDEIDLVAKSVPGSNKKDRMKSVLLLKGIAAYLGTGVARVTFEQLKEACLHYDAYDSGNFAAYLKSFAADVGGSKGAGFTLTARGLTSATELIKGMLGSK